MSENSDPMDFVAYVEQAAILTNLPIVPHYVEGVVENLEQIAAIAHLVSEFPLPEEIEAVPVFEP
ncbi:MAG: DUF4089 domain-containing protein [Kamptonema sp. SIO4C4]|nr:DUF4089 domain-containing protein [Kamptonema sp. SIO4C4]